MIEIVFLLLCIAVFSIDIGYIPLVRLMEPLDSDLGSCSIDCIVLVHASFDHYEGPVIYLSAPYILPSFIQLERKG
jgi:hypothetical protein